MIDPNETQTEYDPNATAESAHGDPTPVDPGLDGLYDEGVDLDAAERVRADVLMPNGSYNSVPPLTATPYQDDDGRRGVYLYGAIISRKPLARQKGQPPEVVEGRVDFRMSNDRRNWDDGGPDYASVLWADAVAAFKQATQTDPGSVRDVVQYISSYPVGLVVVKSGIPTERNPEPKGSPRNRVKSIFPIRE